MHFARLTVPPLVMFLTALWKINGPSFWRDEAATLSAVRRPLPQLWHFLARTDVVHGAYYLLMLPVTRILGTSELAVRLPSALAVAAATAGISAIAARLVSERAGIVAGLMFVVFPVASRYGQEARSYSIVLALAVLASYLLCRALTSASAGKGLWIAYSMALAGLGWMNLMGMLIIPAHGITVCWAIRTAARPKRVAVSWLTSAVAAIVLVSPLVVLAWPQRHGTERFLAITSIRAIAGAPGHLAGSWNILPLVVLLAVMVFWPKLAYPDLGRLCLPWLIVPPAVLLAAGAVFPVYDLRYVLFCVPALALLAGAGLDTLASKSPVRAIVAGMVLLAALGIPAQLSYRGPDGHGDNIRLAAQIVASHEHVGDAVLYQPPWWRQISAAYSYGFARLNDVALYRTPGQAGDFTGIQLPAGQIRKRLLAYQRVWLVEFLNFRPDPALGTAWKAISHWHPSTFVLVLYQRGRPGTGDRVSADRRR